MAIPVASFTATSISGPASLFTTFTDTSTNTPTSWSWNFGDGTTSTSQNPTHGYNSDGVFSVTLTATNASGSGSVTRTQLVHATLAASPVASFLPNATFGVTNTTFYFSDTSTRVPISWSWNFGDGTTSTSQYPSHAYSSAGTYTVSLTVTNKYGSGTATSTNLMTIIDEVSGITRRATSAVASSANPGTSVAVTWPTNNVGDFAILAVATSVTVTLPSGWNFLTSNTTNANAHLYLYWQYISTVQSGTLTLTTASGLSRAAITTYSNGVPQPPSANTNRATVAGTAVTTLSNTATNYAVLSVASAPSPTISGETSSAGVNWVPSEAYDSALASFPSIALIDGATSLNAASAVLSGTLSASVLWTSAWTFPKRILTIPGTVTVLNESWGTADGAYWSNWQTVSGSVIVLSGGGQITPPVGALLAGRADYVYLRSRQDIAVAVQLVGTVSAVEQYAIVGVNANPASDSGVGYSPNEIYVKLSYNATAASSTVSLWQGSTQIGSAVTKTLTGTTSYTVRINRGSLLVNAKVWATATAEPALWDLTGNVSMITTPYPIGVISLAAQNGTATTQRPFQFTLVDTSIPLALETWTGTTGNPWAYPWTTEAGVSIQSNTGSMTSPAVAMSATHAMYMTQLCVSVDAYVTVTGGVAGVVQYVVIGTGSAADFGSSTEWLSGMCVRLNYAATASSSTVGLYYHDVSLTTAITMTLTGTTAYTVRLQITAPFFSGTVRAKVWAASAAEPSAWTISTTYAYESSSGNSQLGYFGLAVASGTATARQFTFTNLMLNAQSPSTQVNSLPFTASFNGTTGNPWSAYWSKALGLDGTIQSAAGQLVTAATTNATTRYDLLALPAMSNTDVVVTVNMASYTTAAFIRVSLNGNEGGSYMSPNDGYYVELDYGFNTITMGNMTGAVDSQWSSIAKTLSAATSYGVRIQRVWQTLRTRVWDASGSEPTTWDDTRTLSETPKTGYVSLAVSTASANAATATFKNLTVSNPLSVGNSKAYVAGAFSAKPTKVWNGSAWIIKPVKVWNGSSWVFTSY